MKAWNKNSRGLPRRRPADRACGSFSIFLQRRHNMVRKIMRFVIILLIKGYKLFISPVLPPACGYHPTCSQYAIEAVREHGAIRGVYLAVNRLFRCTPFHKAGFDPVPHSNKASNR